MPALRGTSARRDRCHQHGPWYSSSTGRRRRARSSVMDSDAAGSYATCRAGAASSPWSERHASVARLPGGPALRTFRLGMTVRETVASVVKVLGPYIGETMARSATEAHCQKLGIQDGASSEQLEGLLGKLGGGLN